jgi:hypothetical protein
VSDCHRENLTQCPSKLSSFQTLPENPISRAEEPAWNLSTEAGVPAQGPDGERMWSLVGSRSGQQEKTSTARTTLATLKERPGTAPSWAPCCLGLQPFFLSSLLFVVESKALGT